MDAYRAQLESFAPEFRQKVPGGAFVDTLAYSIGRRDFEDKALRLLKLLRTAISRLRTNGIVPRQRRRRQPFRCNR